ncbi:uncharacterized protein B0T23DRAFT_324877, partial [Neurospora hispaniola]
IDKYAAPSSLAALEWAHGLRPLVWIFHVTFRAHDNGRASSKSKGVSISYLSTIEYTLLSIAILNSIYIN